MRIFFIFIFILLSGCAASQQAGDRVATESQPVAAALSQSLTGTEYKICPVCQRRFDNTVKMCPYDGQTLKDSK